MIEEESIHKYDHFHMFFRAISTSAVLYARAKPILLIKKFPVTLRLLYPSWSIPALHQFSSAEEITEFFQNRNNFC